MFVNYIKPNIQKMLTCNTFFVGVCTTGITSLMRTLNWFLVPLKGVNRNVNWAVIYIRPAISFSLSVNGIANHNAELHPDGFKPAKKTTSAHHCSIHTYNTRVCEYKRSENAS